MEIGNVFLFISIHKLILMPLAALHAALLGKKVIVRLRNRSTTGSLLLLTPSALVLVKARTVVVVPMHSVMGLEPHLYGDGDLEDNEMELDGDGGETRAALTKALKYQDIYPLKAHQATQDQSLKYKDIYSLNGDEGETRAALTKALKTQDIYPKKAHQATQDTMDAITLRMKTPTQTQLLVELTLLLGARNVAYTLRDGVLTMGLVTVTAPYMPSNVVCNNEELKRQGMEMMREFHKSLRS